MVGNDYCLCAGLCRLDGACGRHDTFNNERHLRVIYNLAHFVDCFAAGIRIHLLEEGETSAVYVHCGGEYACCICDVELFKYGLLIPRLDRRNAHAADSGAVLDGGFHDVRVYAVAREGHNAVVGRCLHQQRVVLLILVLGTVVHVERAERSGKYRG